MGFDVFISYPHQDKATADAACAKLEAAGIRCWIAPRDIAPSSNWAESIVEAIDNCRVMVLIFSAHANRSKQVQREVQQAFDGEKAVVPFRIENVAPEKSLRYYMGSVHWLDALTPPVERHLQQLITSVRALVRTQTLGGDPQKDRMPGEGVPQRVAEQDQLSAEEKERAAQAEEEQRRQKDEHPRKSAAEEERKRLEREGQARREADDRAREAQERARAMSTAAEAVRRRDASKGEQTSKTAEKSAAAQKSVPTTLDKARRFSAALGLVLVGILIVVFVISAFVASLSH